MEEMWLARDKDDTLFLFTGKKPYKSACFWYSNECFRILIPRRLFPEVKWSDDEPTKVKLVIDK